MIWIVAFAICVVAANVALEVRLRRPRCRPSLLITMPLSPGTVPAVTIAPRVLAPPPPPPPVWHAVLSPVSDEQTLLETLRAHPDDAATRLVYGDLLESRGRFAEAQFVRGAQLRTDERERLAQLEPSWRAITSCAPIACSRDDCPGTWSSLEPSPNDETLRTCRACEKTVRHCDGEAASAALARGELLVIEILPRRRAREPTFEPGLSGSERLLRARR